MGPLDARAHEAADPNMRRWDHGRLRVPSNSRSRRAASVALGEVIRRRVRYSRQVFVRHSSGTPAADVQCSSHRVEQDVDPRHQLVGGDRQRREEFHDPAIGTTGLD